ARRHAARYLVHARSSTGILFETTDRRPGRGTDSQAAGAPQVAGAPPEPGALRGQGGRDRPDRPVAGGGLQHPRAAEGEDPGSGADECARGRRGARRTDRRGRGGAGHRPRGRAVPAPSREARDRTSRL
ncbi:MAG: RNA-binding protein YhbY, partial [uncultured Gemmatimonadetes bacterium]